MKVAIRILCIVVTAELVFCGVALSRQLLRNRPVLPAAATEDPVLATDLLQLARAAESGSSADWRELAEALLGQGFYAEAELAFRRSLELNSGDHAAQFGLALCLDRTGRMEASNAAYRQASTLPASGAETISTARHARYAIGKNFLRLEMAAEAEQEFRDNAGFGPSDYQLAKLLVRSGRVTEAMPIIESNLQRTPESLWFRFLLYRAMRELNRPAEAAQAADTLQRSRYVVPLNFNTDYVEPLSRKYGLNRLSEDYNRLLARGDMAAVARRLDRMLELVGERTLPQRSIWLLRLAEVEFQRGNPQRMLALIDQLKALGESNADMLQLEGAAHARTGDMGTAVRLWLRAARMSPNIPLHDMLAQYYESQGDTAARDQHLGQKFLLMAKTQYWSNQFPEALKAAQQAAALIPDYPQSWFYLGEVERQLGQTAAAVEAYQACLERNPDHGRAAKEMARLAAPSSQGANQTLDR